MTPQTELERLFNEQLAGTVPPEAPDHFVDANKKDRNREATPVPALPGNHEGGDL